MASLAFRLLRNSAITLHKKPNGSLIPARCAAWNRDWKPGPYPKTQDEREAAAKKYGLRVEDYEPYDPKVEPGYGDYPKIPWVGTESRDPYGEYDYNHLRSNYGEVLHVDADASIGDRYDPQWEEKTYYSGRFMILSFISVYGVFFILHCLCHKYNIMTHMPAMPKQYPDHLWIQRGKDPAKMPKVVHYTFEPAE